MNCIKHKKGKGVFKSKFKNWITHIITDLAKKEDLRS